MGRLFVMVLLLLAIVLAGLPRLALATVVDASKAEALYKQGKYKEARKAFAAVFEQFRSAPSKDSDDFRTYREAAYIFDRLADCCFTQRDWDGLRRYTDGLFVLSVSERNLTEGQLRGALLGGIARSTADYLAVRLDESVRFTALIQLKRSIALALLDSRGEGAMGQGAIKQYQAMAQALKGVVDYGPGYLELNVPVLQQRMETMDQLYKEVQALGDIDALWKKYPPAADKPVS